MLTKQIGTLWLMGWMLAPNLGYAHDNTALLTQDNHVQALKTDKEKKRVALMRLTGLGLSEAIRKKLQELLFAHLQGMNKWEVMDPEQVDAILEAPGNRHLRHCDHDPVCMRAQGIALGVDQIIYGTIAALGKDYSLALRGLQVGRDVPIEKQDVTLDGDLDVLIPQIRLVAYKMLAPEQIVGKLAIDTALAGIEVKIDGRKVGVTPLMSAIGDLQPGVHAVQLSGFQARSSLVQVHIQPFETTYLAVEVDLLKKSIGSSEQKNSSTTKNHD